MILIVTHREDFTADFVIQKLNERRIPFFRFNCEDVLSYEIAITWLPHFTYSINGIADFTAVWYRRTMMPEIKGDNLSEKLYLQEEIKTFLRNLFAMIPSKWLSDPDKIAIAENKLMQLNLARECGFDIPVTIISTGKEALRSFLKSNTPAVVKPLSRSRIQYSEVNAGIIYTSEVPCNLADQLDTFELTPAIFQMKLEKVYELRVTVVKEKVFAAKIDSQNLPGASTDWRRGEPRFESYQLPSNIAETCRLMLSKLGISFGAFDFVKTPEGRYVFLEVNPNGQWVWIEQQTGLPICDAIIDFLTDTKK